MGNSSWRPVCFGILFILCVCLNFNRAAKSDTFKLSTPKSMAVFGDSIAAAMLADTTSGEQLDFYKQGRLIKASQLPTQSGLEGNELRDALQALGSALHLGAFSGSQTWSHRVKLEAILKKKMEVFDFGLLGATTETLGEQIRNARDFYRNRQKPPADYVTLIIGSNDFCADVSLETFRNNFHFRLYQLLSSHPQSIVLINHVPDVVAVMSAPDTTAFRVGSQKFTCDEIRKQAETCKDSRLSSASPAAKVETAAQKLSEMNQIINQEVARQRDGLGSYKPYSGVLIVAPLPELRGNLNPSLLAADCFHPSALGQKLLADESWKAVAPYFQP